MHVVSNFDPESIKLMGAVCDDVRSELQTTTFFPSPQDRDQFLNDFALRVMNAMADGERDPTRLKAIALDGLDYKSSWRGGRTGTRISRSR